MTESTHSSPPRRRARAAFVAGLVATLAAIGAGPSRAAAQDVTNGSLLVAAPALSDPNFARAVVLVLRSDENGALGVILNRPTNLEPGVVFPELKEGVGTYDGKLYRGGPISPTQLLILVRGLAAATVNGPEVLEKVFLSIDTDALGEMTRLADGTDELRVYAGHAAWAPGQLEAEVRGGGWEIVPGTADLVFSADPGELWNELEGRGGRGSNVVADAR
jgi:putative transcriptional regulator